MKGTTKSGFEFETINKNRLNDMRVIDAINAVKKGDITGLSDLLQFCMDPAERGRLYSHCTTDDGQVSIELVAKEFFEILNYTDETKK